MPNLNDFNAYKSTSGGSGGGGGCSWRVVIGIAVVVWILTLMGKCGA